MENHEEFVMEIPTEVVQTSGGFAMDWGGSAIKIVYLHKEDGLELYKKEKKPTKMKVRLALYSVSQSKEALSMLKNNCYINRKDDASPLVYITGTGCSLNENIIANELGVRCQNIFEVDLFVKAMSYLVNNVPYNDVMYVPTAEMRAKFEKAAKTAHMVIDIWAGKPNKDITDMVWDAAVRQRLDGPMAQSVSDVYPCVLFVLSSVLWSVLIHGDGGFKLTNILHNCGHPFLGIGSAICGSKKTYDELIDLTEKGDFSQVDDYFTEVMQEGKDDSYGGIFQPGFHDFPIYPLRKVAQQYPGTGRLEDCVLSFLRTTCKAMTVTIINTMIIRKVKHAFITGTFAKRKLVREILETEFHRERVFIGHTREGEGLDFEIHFPIAGAHLGALGAFIHNKDSKLTV